MGLPLLSLGLAAAGAPFTVGAAIDVVDQLGFDMTGRAERAGQRIQRNANMAGWAGIMEAGDKGFADDLGVLSSTISNAGDGNVGYQSGPSSETSAFLQQLFAKEGMRLNQIGARAKQMSYMDMAMKAGLM